MFEKAWTHFFFSFRLGLVIFSSTAPRSGLNPGPDWDFSEICSTLRVSISELNEDFFKIFEDYKSSDLALGDTLISGVFACILISSPSRLRPTQTRKSTFPSPVAPLQRECQRIASYPDHKRKCYLSSDRSRKLLGVRSSDWYQNDRLSLKFAFLPLFSKATITLFR